MRISVYLLTLVFFILSCDKPANCDEKGSRLDFYFVKEYETKSQTDEIITESIVLSDEKAISYEEIKVYNKDNHCFEVEKSTIKKLNEEPPIFRKVFALTIDGEIIYTGYFWAAYSSSICNWTVIDYLDYGNNKLCVDQGYPSGLYGQNGPDKRNDSRIIDLLECDKKLEK